MMAEMARVPPNLDKVMNEGIAFIIDRFKHQIPKCPLGQLPVMIGRRKRAYDTLDKVMKRTGFDYEYHVSHEFYCDRYTIRDCD